MNDRKMTKPAAMAHRNPWMTAVTAFVVGFLSGVAFFAYRTGAESSTNPGVASSMNYVQIARTLENDVANNPQNTNAWIQLGNVYFDNDQYPRAIDAYQKALGLNPQNPEVLTDLGIMYRRMGQPRQAIQSFNKAVAVDPRHENARLNKGIVMMHDLKDRDGAIRVWEELLEINPLAMAGDNQSVDQLIKHYKEHETNAAK